MICQSIYVWRRKSKLSSPSTASLRAFWWDSHRKTIGSITDWSTTRVSLGESPRRVTACEPARECGLRISNLGGRELGAEPADEVDRGRILVSRGVSSLQAAPAALLHRPMPCQSSS